MRNVSDREIRSRLREFLEFGSRSSVFRLVAEVPEDRLTAIVQGDGMTNAERVIIAEHACMAQWEIKSDWLAWSLIAISSAIAYIAFAIAWLFQLPTKLLRRT